MGCKHRCINCSKVLDSRRAFQLVYTVSGISNDSSMITIEVIVIGLGIPQSTRENIGSTADKSGSASDNSGSTSNHSGVVWENRIH